MNIILIANIISFVGATLMVLIGFIKDNKKVLRAQNLQFILMGTANFMLGGISGFVANVVSIARNTYSIRKPMSLPVKIGFIGIQIVLSVVAGLGGFIGLLPIISNIIFTFYADTDNQHTFKLAIIISGAMWIFYDFYYMNFSSATFDVLSFISNTATLLMMRRATRLEGSLS